MREKTRKINIPPLPLQAFNTPSSTKRESRELDPCNVMFVSSWHIRWGGSSLHIAPPFTGVRLNIALCPHAQDTGKKNVYCSGCSPDSSRAANPSPTEIYKTTLSIFCFVRGMFMNDQRLSSWCTLSDGERFFIRPAARLLHQRPEQKQEQERKQKWEERQALSEQHPQQDQQEQ